MTGARKHLKPSLRQAGISELVSKLGAASVEQLADKFATSSETIRRDLTVLADAGQLRKVHGGARAAVVQGEGGFDVRMRQNVLAKNLIAEKLLKQVKSGQTIFMDTGSTTLICAEALAKIKRLTLITNSTRIAAAFATGAGRADVYLLGGLYSGGNAQTIGAGAISDIATYSADVAVLTVGAVNSQAVADYSNHEAMVARAMQQASVKTIIVADHTKFEKRAVFNLCGLSEIDLLVADKKPEAALRTALISAGVEIV